MKLAIILGVIAAALLLLLVSRLPSDTKSAIESDELTIQIGQLDDLSEGDLHHVPFQFANRSSKPVILLSLRSPEPKPLSFSWSYQTPGAFHLEDEVLVFNPIAQMLATGYWRITGLILPGELREWEIPIKFLQSGKVSRDFTLTCLALDFEELRKVCFIPDQDAPEGSTPRYVHPTSLEQLANAEEIIIPDAAYERAVERDFAFSFQIAPREFSISDALAAIGFESKSYTFSQLLEAWVIETEEATLVVTEEEITNVGRTGLEVFELVDETPGSELEMVFPEVEWEGFEEIMEEIEEELAKNYELDHHKGLILRVPKEDLVSILVYLAGRGCTVRVGDWYARPAFMVTPG